MDSSDDEPALHYPGQRPREKTRETPAAAAGGGGGGDDGVLDLANAMTEQMVIPTEYSQQEVDKMMREKEREVKAQFQAEEDAIKKEINEINAKLDDSKIHDRRQLEEIKKQSSMLREERERNRNLERVNEGYLNSKLDTEHETDGVVRAGAREMYRLMLEESRKLAEFATFVRDTVDPDCSELDDFIEDQKRFLVKIENDPYLMTEGGGGGGSGELKLFQIHRMDWDPERLFIEIHQAITEHQAGTFQPPPQPTPAAPENPQPEEQASSSSTAQKMQEAMYRLMTTVRDVYPDMSNEEVLKAMREVKEANNGKLQSIQQIIQWIAHNSQENEAQPPEEAHLCPICKQELQETGQALQFKMPCCGQLFHTLCIQEWLQNNEACPKCNK